MTERVFQHDLCLSRAGAGRVCRINARLSHIGHQDNSIYDRSLRHAISRGLPRPFLRRPPLPCSSLPCPSPPREPFPAQSSTSPVLPGNLRELLLIRQVSQDPHQQARGILDDLAWRGSRRFAPSEIQRLPPGGSPLHPRTLKVQSSWEVFSRGLLSGCYKREQLRFIVKSISDVLVNAITPDRTRTGKSNNV